LISINVLDEILALLNFCKYLFKFIFEKNMYAKMYSKAY